MQLSTVAWRESDLVDGTGQKGSHMNLAQMKDDTIPTKLLAIGYYIKA